MKKITEQTSLYRHLEAMSTEEMLTNINREDQKVAKVVKKLIPEISALVEDVADHMLSGGRLFYVGAGTSGRLGIVDASECPPTFGVALGMVVGIIAGGDGAIRKAVEFAEDNYEQGWLDLQRHDISSRDVVIGIAASGTTPYVVGALQQSKRNGIVTGCITCNPGAPVTKFADHPIEAAVGPEFITGSTRMKAGTAQKLLLNMLSTGTMVRLGRVQGNRMVDLQLKCEKLVERARNMVLEESGCSVSQATAALQATGGHVRKAMEWLKKQQRR